MFTFSSQISCSEGLYYIYIATAVALQSGFHFLEYFSKHKAVLLKMFVRIQRLPHSLVEFSAFTKPGFARFFSHWLVNRLTDSWVKALRLPPTKG